MALTGTLNVDVVRASDLLACDRNGKSDPYVVVRPLVPRGAPPARPPKAKTSVKKKTLEPVWTETLVLAFTDVSELEIKVMDWDLVGSDECGSAVVNLTELDVQAGTPRRVVLDLKPQGTLQLVFRFDDAACLFGLDLASICAREHQDVPHIVKKCIACVEDLGLKREGIYRVPGPSAKVTAMKQQFIANASTASVPHDEASVNVAASLLKLFFRELPEPLFTNALHPEICNAADLPDGPRKKAAFVAITHKLPRSHRDTAAFLFDHLARVHSFSSVNKMTSQNLGTCFAPTLMTPSTPIEHGAAEAEPISPTHLIAQMASLRSQNLAFVYLLQNPDVFALEAEEEVDEVETFTGFGKRHSVTQNMGLMFEETCDGELSFQDFRRMAYDLGQYIEVNDRSQFETIDTDKDGKISWDEFQIWWASHSDVWALEPGRQQALTQAISYFKYFDFDDSGSLNQDEFAELHADLLKCGYDIDRSADACFRALDFDGNGSISFNEFVRWMVKNEFV